MRLNAGGYSLKRHPASLKLNIAYGFASGYTQKEIGLSLGVHQSTISRHARRPDVVEMIRVEEERVVRELGEHYRRAAQDPAVQAETYEICKRTLMKSIKKALA
jgi:IS30 family transposase